MDRLALSPWHKLWRRRFLAPGLCAAGLCLTGPGCAQFRTSASIYGAQGENAVEGGLPSVQMASMIVPAAYHQMDKLPAIGPDQAATASPAPSAPTGLPMPQAMQGSPVVPIGLDTIFRLAEQQNAQVGLARAKLQQACAEQDVAAYRWLPDFFVGTSYYRHEGGIADFNGFLINSSFSSMFAGGELAGHYDLKDIAFQQVSA